MSEHKEERNLVLLIASILVCSLRYLAILLPNWQIFSIWKSLEEAPQQYCLDFAVIVIFIVNTYSILRDKTEKTAMVYWTEAISFASIVPAWRYIVDFFDWLETGELGELNKIMGNAKGTFKVLLEIAAALIVIAIIVWIFLHRSKIKKIMFAAFQTVKKDVFMAQFIVILSIVHFIRLGIFFFIKNGFWVSISYDNKIDIIISTAFLIALLMILNHYRKKEETLTPAAWVGILLCLLGIVPIQSSIAKEILAVLYPDGAKKGFYFIVQLFLLSFMTFALLAVLVLFVWIYQKFRSIKFRETKFWKTYEKELLLEHRKIWFLYFITCLLFIFGAVLVFVKWIGSGAYFIQEGSDIIRKLLQVLGVLISAVLFLLFVMIALCQMGAFLMRTLKRMDILAESNKKNYYIIHGFSGFLALIFTFISWCIFANLSFREESLLGLTISVFQYFALPVILMVWYSILFEILDMILKRENEESNEIIMQIEKHTYELSYHFINAVFAPFRFLFSYINILSEAMLEEDNDDDNSSKKDNRKISSNHKKEKKKRKIKAAKKENRKKLWEDKEIVNIKYHKRKTKGGIQ